MTTKIIMLQERLDAANAGSLRAEIKAAIDSGIRALILDCALTEFIDSSGLAALVSGHKAMRIQKGQFILARVNGGARDIFDLTRMDLVFTMFPTLAAAKAKAGEAV